MEIKNKMFFYTLFLRVKCIFTVCFHYPNVRSFSQSKKTKNDVRTFSLKLNIDQSLDNK
jgi:hypothetical protein